MLAICAGLAFAQAAAESTERVGIISAMSNEIQLLLDNAEIERVENIGGVDFHVGKLRDKDVVIMKSGIGKVLASSAATTMMDHYNISRILFTGIAGTVGKRNLPVHPGTCRSGIQSRNRDNRSGQCLQGNHRHGRPVHRIGVVREGTQG